MAGWWRGGRERPWTSGTTWWRYAQGTTWTRTDWHDPAWQDGGSRQWGGSTGDWHVSQWEGSWDDGPRTATPPSPELAVHEPEQYPWACLQSQDVQQASLGSEDSTLQARAAADVPNTTLDASCNGDPSQGHKTEEEELERLHAIAVKRFRQARPSLDSDGEADSIAMSTTEDYPVDPDIGTYDPNTKGVHCKLCDMDLNSKKQFVDHLKGQKHRKKHDRKEREAKEAAEAARAALASPLQ